ncbi:MAG: hypothetical protein H8E46_10390 [FCB group bacterium]|nr:hypothetical protein [FCB group bacterium]
MGSYAKSADIYSTYKKWRNACNHFDASLTILNQIPGDYQSLEWLVCSRILNNDKALFSKGYEKARKHRDLVHNEYRKAKAEESTMAGSVKRGAGRLFEKFSKTRVGKEVTVSVKTLVLGGKAFYDFIQLGSSGDVMSWAQSYESDLNQLYREVDEIQRMDEPSLTGANTIIEDIVNKAYEKSFTN